MRRLNLLLLGIFLISLTFISAAPETWKYNYLPQGERVQYGGNYSINTNYSTTADFWDLLDTPADILHNLLDNLAWSVAGHTIDTDLETNGNNINLGSGNVTEINWLAFNVTGCPDDIDTSLAGYMCWDGDKNVLIQVTGLGNVVQISQEMFKTVKNVAGQTIYDGQVVSTNGSVGEVGTVVLADANATDPQIHNLGMVTVPFCNDNAECIITMIGEVHDVPTSAFAEGDNVYLTCDGSGNLTNVRQPILECYHIYLGKVLRSHASTGIIDFMPMLELSNGVTIHQLGILTNLTVVGGIFAQENVDISENLTVTGTATFGGCPDGYVADSWGGCAFHSSTIEDVDYSGLYFVNLTLWDSSITDTFNYVKFSSGSDGCIDPLYDDSCIQLDYGVEPRIGFSDSNIVLANPTCSDSVAYIYNSAGCSSPAGGGTVIDGGDINTTNIYSTGNITTNCITLEDGFEYCTLATTYYNATSYTIVEGTLDGGTINDTQHPNGDYDGVTLNFSETTGSPALDIRFNFTDGMTDFNNVIIRLKGSDPSQELNLQLYDFDSSTWENYKNINGLEEEFEIIEFGVFDASEHIDNGTVVLRLYHPDAGNIQHEIFIDWLAVSKGFGTPVGDEIDPLSYHKTENINATGYNVTADYFFGNGSQLTGLPDPDLTPYWKSDGTSTATGNWNLSDKNLTTRGEGSFGHVHVGLNGTADPVVMFDGATNDGSLTYDESSNQFLFDGGLFIQPTTPTTNSQAILISNNPTPISANQQFRNLAFSSTFILESRSDQNRFTGIQSDGSAIYGGFGGFGSADDLIMKGVTTKVTKTAGTAGNFPNSKHYGYYIEQVSGGTAENWGLYNADDVDIFMGLDNSKTIIGTGLDVETYWDANDYVINTTTGNVHFKNNTGWGEIEYGNAIDHTYLTDATDKEAYELVKSQQAHEYNLDGTYNYSSWGECYVQGETTDYSRPEIEYYEIEEEVWDNSTGEWLNTNTTEMVTYEREIYPYTIQTEGTNVGCKQVMIQKAQAYRNSRLNLENDEIVSADKLLVNEIHTNTPHDNNTMTKIENFRDTLKTKTFQQVKDFVLDASGKLSDNILFDKEISEYGSWKVFEIAHFNRAMVIFLMKENLNQAEEIQELKDKEAARDACWDLNTQAEIIACQRAI